VIGLGSSGLILTVVANDVGTFRLVAEIWIWSSFRWWRKSQPGLNPRESCRPLDVLAGAKLGHFIEKQTDNYI